MFSKSQRTKVFSILDVRSGYYNITVAKDSRKYTAFNIEYSKYKLLQVPVGIHVAPSYFALMINDTLKGLDFCFAYPDDKIFMKSETDYLDHLQQVFDFLHQANIKL